MAEYASAPGLYTVLITEFDLAHVEPDEPTILWQFYLRLPGEDPEHVAEGVAPTFEEAAARCETVLRIEINARPPSANLR